MELLHPRRARRQNKINSRVQDVASVVASSIFDSITEQETGPYHVEIGRKPEGIATEEYLERVRAAVVGGLSRVGCAAMVEYDPEGTERASTHIVEPVDSGHEVREWDNRHLQVVFRHPAVALAAQ